MVALAEGQYFFALVRVSPGHDEYFPAPMALVHVDRTGYPASAWKYQIKSATLGRSYALYDANVVCLESLGILGRFYSPGCRTTRQRRGPVASRQPVSTAVPCLSRTMTALQYTR